MNSMRISPGFRTTVLLLAASIVPPLHAEQGLLTFVFGPSSQEAARQSARAAAATARHWLQTTGSVVEPRRPGSPDAKRIGGGGGVKKLERAFNDRAPPARDADPP